MDGPNIEGGNNPGQPIAQTPSNEGEFVRTPEAERVRTRAATDQAAAAGEAQALRINPITMEEQTIGPDKPDDQGNRELADAMKGGGIPNAEAFIAANAAAESYKDKSLSGENAKNFAEVLRTSGYNKETGDTFLTLNGYDDAEERKNVTDLLPEPTKDDKTALSEQEQQIREAGFDEAGQQAKGMTESSIEENKAEIDHNLEQLSHTTGKAHEEVEHKLHLLHAQREYLHHKMKEVKKWLNVDKKEWMIRGGRGLFWSGVTAFYTVIFMMNMFHKAGQIRGGK